MNKILIVGYHGYGNSGDEAILLAMKNNMLRLYPDADIAALSHRPEDTAAQYGIKSVKRFNAFTVLREIWRRDVVVVGGGTLVQDGTSARSLYYYLGIIWMAKLLRKRVMLYANGVGPLKRRIGRFMTRKIVNRVDLITLREALSGDELAACGVTKPQTVVTADPVFTLDGISRDAALDVLRAEGIPTDAPLIGISVREWKRAVGFTEQLARLCDHMAEAYGARILLIPMQYPQDLEISGAIADAMTQPAYILRQKWPPETLLGVTGLMELVVSMRLHALIYAAVQNVPMLGIVYDPKIQFYLKALDMPCAGDVREDALDVERMKAQADALMREREACVNALREKADGLRAKGYENDTLLGVLMRDIR